jgi:SsrA-binding protein
MKLLANNKKAYHDFFVLTEIDAGIRLAGNEVKSLRQNNASFNNAFIVVENGEAYIYGLHIKPYEHGTVWNVDPDRKRKLLLHKNEILLIKLKCTEKSLTAIPLKVFFEGSLVKVTVGLCRGKKLYDKRACLKDRDMKRDAEHALKQEV